MEHKEHDELKYIGEMLYVLHKNNRKFLNDSLREYNLNLLQAMCLLMICGNQNTTQQDLKEKYYLTKSAITKALSKLEKQKYITRKISKEDGRQYELSLTEKGIKILPVIIEINNKWEEGIGLNELDESFTKILYQLAAKSVKLNENRN